jgi:HAMP domain-containing protein
MDQSLSVETLKSARFFSIDWQRFGLMWRVVGTFAGVIIIFGLLVLGAVHHLMFRALEAQLHQRSLAIVTNLSDAAAGYVLARNSLQLHALMTKYALLDGVAYAFIQDTKGSILARSPGSFPTQVLESFSADVARQVHRRELMLQGKKVYETHVPMLGGQVGTAHVGVWGDSIADEIRRDLVPLIGLIISLLVAGVAVAIFIARGIVRPILRLREVADKISMGDLEAPVPVETRDEIGDLARSLGRMRASLKAAMVRLNRG